MLPVMQTFLPIVSEYQNIPVQAVGLLTLLPLLAYHTNTPTNYPSTNNY